MTDMNVNANPGVNQVKKLGSTPKDEAAKKAEVENSIFETNEKLKEFVREGRKGSPNVNIGGSIKNGANVIRNKIDEIRKSLAQVNDAAFVETKKTIINQIEKKMIKTVVKMENQDVNQDGSMVVKNSQ